MHRRENNGVLWCVELEHEVRTIDVNTQIIFGVGLSSDTVAKVKENQTAKILFPHVKAKSRDSHHLVYVKGMDDRSDDLF